MLMVDVRVGMRRCRGTLVRVSGRALPPFQAGLLMMGSCSIWWGVHISVGSSEKGGGGTCSRKKVSVFGIGVRVCVCI